MDASTFDMHWKDFTRDMSVLMADKGWPSYFLVTPAVYDLVRAQTEGKRLEWTHILGIPFECCRPEAIQARAEALKARGKIVWTIDAGEQYERAEQADGQMGSTTQKAPPTTRGGQPSLD